MYSRLLLESLFYYAVSDCGEHLWISVTRNIAVFQWYFSFSLVISRFILSSIVLLVFNTGVDCGNSYHSEHLLIEDCRLVYEENNQLNV